jgi:hypothetical protein
MVGLLSRQAAVALGEGGRFGRQRRSGGEVRGWAAPDS